MYKLFDFAIEPRVSNTDELYFHKKGHIYSFDTYFNVIPVRKLKRYTTVSELVFSQPVEICSEHGTLKYGNRILLDKIPDNAELLYIKTTISYGSISVYAEGKAQSIKPVVIICTYQREKQVKANIDYLLKKIEDTKIEIVLVDNASEIPTDNWNSVGITVLHNVNNGGSGGYAFGMKYAVEQKRFTHMILMDDDATIDIISLQKMTGFLTFIKDEYCDLSIAGSMLYADEPTIQFESGGYFSSDGQQTGYGYDFNLTNMQSLIENESDKLINYGGWWLFCMPMKYAVEGQYPAPFFIKYDDVEYALRCSLNIITLNGVGVWHENFGNKYNSVQEYFNTRNYLFLMKRHSLNFTPEKTYKTARYLLLEKLCRHQYKMAEAVLIAYEDFLKGEEYLTQINYTEKLTQLKELNYKMLSETELNKKYGILFDEKLYKQCSKQKFRRYMQPLLYGHLIPCFLCRKLTITDIISDRKEHYIKAKKTLHFNVNNKYGYITIKSLISFISYMIRIKKIYKRCC